MYKIRTNRIVTPIVTFLTALILFGAMAVSYDVSTVDDRGAVAEAHTNYYCGHGSDGAWVSGVYWTVQWQWTMEYDGMHYHYYKHYRWGTTYAHDELKWCGFA